MAKFYLVGGAVRDEIINEIHGEYLKNKDLDYAVEAESYDAMREAIVERGGTIFLETPEFFTIRAKVPKLGASDFVLCRKEGSYSDGRHPDKVEMGTLYDDLARRDFTMNAIAKDEEGNYIDPFDGRKDILFRTIKCVGDTSERMNEDALRILRAVRFMITRQMYLSKEITSCFTDFDLLNKLESISRDRIREELQKCFKEDTLKMLFFLKEYPILCRRIFYYNGKGEMWLKPTFEQ